ncbi:MAG: hypothetical protein RL518_2380 [Pseudomonadota bacterium]
MAHSDGGRIPPRRTPDRYDSGQSFIALHLRTLLRRTKTVSIAEPVALSSELVPPHRNVLEVNKLQLL